MNCLRSLEYIKKIDNKYKKYGLKTILIHSPEWEFEKNSNNVLRAAKQYHIKIPIIIDKDKKIIKKLKINFWPTQILIKNNRIIYKHIGEGNYKKLENKIRAILKIKSNAVFNNEPKYTKFQTIYAGKKKGGGSLDKKGHWKQNNEFLEGKGFLTLKTKGNIISLVAKSISNKPINVKIKVDNKLIKKMKINEPQLYKVVELKNNKSRTLTIETKSKIAVYSFAFQ